MFRLLSYSLLVIGVALFGAHVSCAMQTGEGEVIQRGGALLIAVGVVLAALPYLRASFKQQVASRLPHDPRPFPHSSTTSAQVHNRIEEARGKVTFDVIVERYVAFVLIFGGTLLNGYGDLLGRWLGIVP